MFTQADDAGLGVTIVHEPYPDGEEGIQKSLAVMCVKVREGAPTAAMKSFAANLMKQAGFPDGATAQGQAVLDYIRANAMYAPDALGTEQIQSANITLCIEGAPICIPCGDCDDLSVAAATVMAALGHEVEIVRQKFGRGDQQHVIVEVKDDDTGLWIPLDPSSKTMPAGKKVRATSETRHSPLTGSLGASFVGIGALPMWIWKQEKWERVGAGADIEHLAGACCTACSEGKTCEGKSCDTTRVQPQPQRGFGAPWPSLTSLTPQWAWLKQVWPAFDSSGRSWDATIASAYARGASRQWISGDPISRSDLVALIIATQFSARAVATMPGPGQRVADDLNRTWYILAQKIGFTSDMTLDKLKALAQKEQDPANAAAAIAIFELLAIVVAIAAQVVIACFAIYYAYKIIDSLLTRLVAFAELIYLEIQVEQITERHLANPDLPWTEQELKQLDNLEEMQRGAHAAITAAPSSDKPPPDTGAPWWVYAGAGTVVVGGIVAIVYREQIKRWLDKRSAHKRLPAASEARRRRHRRLAA